MGHALKVHQPFIMSIPPLTIKLGEVLNAELFRKYDEDLRNFLVFNQIPFDPDNLPAVELSRRQATELLEELATAQDEANS